MAEKKKDEFSYGSAFLPEGERKYSVIRWGWNGLNRTDKIDTGQLTDMSGMVCDPPYMEPVKYAKEIIDFSTGIPVRENGAVMTPVATAQRHSGTPVSISGNSPDGTIITLVWRDEDNDKIVLSRYSYYPHDDDTITHGWYCVGDFTLGNATGVDTTDLAPRSIQMFNAVDTSTGNIATYTYDRKQLVYPDCYAVPYSISGSALSFNTQGNPIPVPEFATVYGSRVFGVDSNKVAASAYNSYVDYSVDTSDDISSAHAWMSMAGSSTDSDGIFTAVCTYDNHVVLFKKDFMQLVYNNKNPFRIVDVGKFGCDNNNAWAILNGVLFFASKEKVYTYSGGTPKEISAKLEVGDLSGAVLGSFKDTLWMQTKDSLYTYKPKTGMWSNVGQAPFGGAHVRVEQFAALDYGLVALANLSPDNQSPDYALYMVDWDIELMDLSDDAAEDWKAEYPTHWSFATDLMALGKLDLRRVKKFSMLCEGNKGATITVYLLKDGDMWIDRDREKKLVGEFTLDSTGIHVIRVLTRQFSATMHQLYFVGSGYMKIHAAELKVSWGGDVYADS